MAYDYLELRCKLTPEKPSLKALEIAHIIDLPMTLGLSRNEARLKVAKDLGLTEESWVVRDGHRRYGTPKGKQAKSD